MQITLAQDGDDISTILSQFEHDFSLDFEDDFSLATAEINKCVESASQLFILFSIQKLKEMADFLSQAFTVPLDAPKRNSKVSLSKWIAQVLLAAQLENEKTSEVSVTPEVEVLEPEPKPVYEVRLLADDLFSSNHLLSDIPPYLVRNGKLFQKTVTHDFLPSACYIETFAEHLSNVETLDHGTAIQLLTGDLVVIETFICQTPPAHLITKEGGVYKRMRRQLIASFGTVRYSQVIAEHLSNIAVT